jgi:hypothetical protein
MLDPIGVQMLQLDPIMTWQPLEEVVGRTRKPMLVEGDKRDDVAVERRQHILTFGMSHSITAVLTWRKPCLTKLSMCLWVMLERAHGSMGSEGRGIRALPSAEEWEQETLALAAME